MNDICEEHGSFNYRLDMTSSDLINMPTEMCSHPCAYSISAICFIHVMKDRVAGVPRVARASILIWQNHDMPGGGGTELYPDDAEAPGGGGGGALESGGGGGGADPLS